MRLGSVTADQMATVEEQLTNRLGLDPLVRCENAAGAVAEQVRRMLGSLTNRPIVILVGSGSGAEVGVATARRLANWGAQPTILLALDRHAAPSQIARQLELAERCGVPVFDPGALMPPAELIVDGLTGYQPPSRLTDHAAELAALALGVKVPILAIDVPSGLDATTGKADQPAIRADVTVALGYPKAGTCKPFAANLVGQLLVADLGIPALTWQQFGQPAPDFSQSRLIQVDLKS